MRTKYKRKRLRPSLGLYRDHESFDTYRKKFMNAPTKAGKKQILEKLRNYIQTTAQMNQFEVFEESL